MRVHQAKNLREKVQGLIGSKKPKNFLLKTRFGIHTFGLTFPIDVVILNKSHQVVVLKENLKPYNIFLWNPRYDTVLELPEGTIREEKIELGKKIELQ